MTLRKPALTRPTSMNLAATEYTRVLAQLQRLAPEDWTRPTNCAGWDVRAMATHVLGMAEMIASPLELRRQMSKATKRGGLFIDALTGLQVEEHQDLDPAQVTAGVAKAGPRAARGRKRIPGLIRHKKLPAEQCDGIEPWTLGYLVDVILTRDPWMHRLDIADAVGQKPELTAEHDGVLVDDVVREWAVRHGQPCTLTLTGPAGGSWTFGTGGPDLTLDAIEFCRAISGRSQAEGLLATVVPF
jgi:uncharacterized protein (TIGR03083 family)